MAGKLAPKDLFPAHTYHWWAKCVQLDLEARGEVVRDAKAKPLRWRRGVTAVSWSRRAA